MSSNCKSKVFPTSKGIVRIECHQAKNGMHLARGMVVKDSSATTGQKVGINCSGTTCDEAISKAEKRLSEIGYVDQGSSPAAKPIGQPATATQTTAKAVPVGGNTNKSQ